MTEGTIGPKGELGFHDWLRNDETQALMKALASEGGVSRFVGGCVRNALLGEPVTDVDIATALRPDDVIRLLEAASIKVVPTGLEHGTVTAISGGRSFEITTLRVDVATDGRRADVAFTQDWVADASRRDFTLNALYCDADGTVYDPLGGRADLAARRVRFIGDANARIAEDYLRILRFFRMQAAYGGKEWDSEGLKACAEGRAGLTQLSGERVYSELLKIAACDRAAEAYRKMAAIGVLTIILPEATRLDRFERLVDIEASQLFSCDAVLRFASVLGADRGALLDLAHRLHLSNKDRDRIVAMLMDETKIVCYLSMREVRRALYWMGPELFKDRVMLGWASDGKESNSFQWRALLAMADSWERPKLPLTGQMIRS